VGRKVELVFDPFDLTHIEVRHNGKPMGLATPQVIGRHVHPKARPDLPATPPPPTGIDYLHLVAAAHDAADARRINFDAITSPPPDQASIPEPNPAPGDQPGTTEEDQR
jgi:putative transposase